MIAMPNTDSTAVSSPSSPSSSRSCSESTSLVSREITLPEVYFSWKDSDSRCAWAKIRCRRSSSTSWPNRPDTFRNAKRSPAEPSPEAR